MVIRERAINWKRNLMALWVAQVATTLGFSFTFPFYPLFFEDLGGFSTERAAFWAGMAGWVFGFGMGVFSPIWGILGDRYGRKLNVLRSMLLGSVLLGISAFAETPLQLLGSRFLIGATSGVLPAIMALVASHTPRDKLPFASGAVQSGLFLGIALGPLLGGIIYDSAGMPAAFFATAAALLGAGLIVLLLVREDFHAPTHSEGPVKPFVDLWRLSTSRVILPLYIVILLVLMANLVIQPAIPGLASIVEGGSDSGTASGIVFAVMGLGSAVSSIGMGWLAGRFGLRPVLIVGAAASALATLIPYFANDYLLLAAGIAVISLFAGGLSGLVNGLIAMRAPPGQHGAAFGSAQLAHAVGIAMGPLFGGAAVIGWGLRSVFLLEMACFVLVFVVVVVLMGSSGRKETAGAAASGE